MYNIVSIKNKPFVSTLTANEIFLYIGFFFFLLMLVIPTTYQLERGVLLSILCLGAFMKASIGTWKLDKQIMYILIITICASLSFMLNGAVHNAPGALRVGTVYVAWPLLYVFFAGFFQNTNMVVRFERVILAGIIISSIMGILFVFDIFWGLGLQTRHLFEFQGAGVSFYHGFIEYRLYNMTTLIYGFPFLFTLLLLSSKNKASRRDHVWAWFAFVLVVIAALISGRRAFWLVILVTPIISLIILYFSGLKKSMKKSLYIFFAFLFVISFAIYLNPSTNFHDIKVEFFSAFDFSGEMSAKLRYLQFKALMHEWMDKPILGHGLGSAASGIVRSHTQAWAFELSYVSLLFHTGIVGISIYTSAVAWIFWSGIKIVRRNPQLSHIILPLLTGLAGFLIVNATNPYLGKFDYLWTIFLPVAAINAYRTGIHK